MTDALGNWQTMLSDEFLAYGMRPVAPASYDPERHIWSRSYSAGHNYNNQLAVALVEVTGAEIVKAINEGQLGSLVHEVAQNVMTRYQKRMAEPIVLQSVTVPTRGEL